MQNKSTLFRVISIVFYVLAALLFFMRTEENGYMTFAVISLAIGAVFSSVSAAITLKNKDKNDADDNTDEQTNDNPEKKIKSENGVKTLAFFGIMYYNRTNLTVEIEAQGLKVTSFITRRRGTMRKEVLPKPLRVRTARQVGRR